MFRNLSKRTKIIIGLSTTLGVGIVTLAKTKPFIAKKCLAFHGIEYIHNVLRNDNANALERMEKTLISSTPFSVPIDPTEFILYLQSVSANDSSDSPMFESEYKINEQGIINFRAIAKLLEHTITFRNNPKIVEYLLKTGRMSRHEVGTMINEKPKLSQNDVAFVLRHNLIEYVSQYAIENLVFESKELDDTNYALFSQWREHICNNVPISVQTSEGVILRHLSSLQINIDAIIATPARFGIESKDITINPPILINNQMLNCLTDLSAKGFKFSATEWIYRIHFSAHCRKELAKYDHNLTIESINRDLMDNATKLMKELGGNDKIELEKLIEDVKKYVKWYTADADAYDDISFFSSNVENPISVPTIKSGSSFLCTHLVF